MKKANEITAKVLDTANGKFVDVLAHVEDEEYGEVTLGYELGGEGEKFVISYGRINAEDPGDVPSEEFADRNAVAESEYAEVFEEMYDIAARRYAAN